MIKTALTNDAFEQAIIQGDFNMYTQASKRQNVLTQNVKF